MVSDAEAGFPSCKKAVLGNAPTIALLPGEAVTFAIQACNGNGASGGSPLGCGVASANYSLSTGWCAAP